MKVSIVIPTYNEEKNIGRLLTSIKNQTYKDIEAIVVDDGSSDDTVKIAQKYTSKVFKRKHAERSIQRNFGASKSSGKYLIFLDADMELTPKVVESCVKKAKTTGAKAITIAETTVVTSFITRVRKFEREMYMGDAEIEVPRFFDRKVFFEFHGYDPKITGPEDYDLPYRISKKYKISRVSEYILHHEESRGLKNLLQKKYYYASKGAYHAQKHPELVRSQGNLFFRKVYFKNWRKFIAHPIIGFSFIIIRLLEAIWAVAGFISAVGFKKFLQTLFNLV